MVGRTTVVGETDRGVRIMTISRPEKRNALDAATCDGLLKEFEGAAAAGDIRVLLLQSDGPSFCAGLDLKEAGASQTTPAHERLFSAFAWLSKPLITAVQGHAVGGGLGLAVLGDVIFAADDAQFGLPEVTRRLWPYLVFPAVSRRIGEAHALELALDGALIGAQEAERRRLVSRVVPAGALRALALAAAHGMARHDAEVLQRGLEHVRARTRDEWMGAVARAASARAEHLGNMS
ncbi:enoyl-CoA hydratase/isomerase family protein [Nannocystis bainbridge]|uniref:Enoyl-CoA hydratase/isomerase family protein n=1 Tax=Nannocystis bainbridge TaxID=2995303 RepID=A0ABT5E6F4_9BACT|nr:enoyl-CoA hydratase/isomerase family protein [Nannocystis bainbridge]MDC0720346.1 enoyl-CoA hydratase/isomerase family protein [Nannocystis bainbridge]